MKIFYILRKEVRALWIIIVCLNGTGGNSVMKIISMQTSYGILLVSYYIFIPSFSLSLSLSLSLSFTVDLCIHDQTEWKVI